MYFVEKKKGKGIIIKTYINMKIQNHFFSKALLKTPMKNDLLLAEMGL
jgi:hypothetical protein